MAILKNYVAPTAVNPFKSVIDELVDAGDGAAFEHIANTEKVEGKRGSIATDRKRIQDAARDAGYTARIVESEDREDGTTRIVAVLAPKRVRRSKDELAAETEGKSKGK